MSSESVPVGEDGIRHLRKDSKSQGDRDEQQPVQSMRIRWIVWAAGVALLGFAVAYLFRGGDSAPTAGASGDTTTVTGGRLRTGTGKGGAARVPVSPDTVGTVPTPVATTEESAVGATGGGVPDGVSSDVAAAGGTRIRVGFDGGPAQRFGGAVVVSIDVVNDGADPVLVPPPQAAFTDLLKVEVRFPGTVSAPLEAGRWYVVSGQGMPAVRIDRVHGTGWPRLERGSSGRWFADLSQAVLFDQRGDKRTRLWSGTLSTLAASFDVRITVGPLGRPPVELAVASWSAAPDSGPGEGGFEWLAERGLASKIGSAGTRLTARSAPDVIGPFAEYLGKFPGSAPESDVRYALGCAYKAVGRAADAEAEFARIVSQSHAPYARSRARWSLARMLCAREAWPELRTLLAGRDEAERSFNLQDAFEGIEGCVPSR